MSSGQIPVLVEVHAARRHVRRIADLLVLALAMPMVLPVIALLAVVVKLDSPGPAFVRIQRLGRNGRPFGLLKLRTMRRDAERLKRTLEHLNILPWPDFKVADDPRVTPAGRWLRHYSLDELPQLYNVLRGEITLHRPRPCSIALADYELWQTERLDVTPGLVGGGRPTGAEQWISPAGADWTSARRSRARSAWISSS